MRECLAQGQVAVRCLDQGVLVAYRKPAFAMITVAAVVGVLAFLVAVERHAAAQQVRLIPANGALQSEMFCQVC